MVSSRVHNSRFQGNCFREYFHWIIWWRRTCLLWLSFSLNTFSGTHIMGWLNFRHHLNVWVQKKKIEICRYFLRNRKSSLVITYSFYGYIQYVVQYFVRIQDEFVDINRNSWIQYYVNKIWIFLYFSVPNVQCIKNIFWIWK